MKNCRSFNVRFKGTIETCVTAERVAFDEKSVSFFVDMDIVFYASLSDIVYVKEFFIDDCTFESLYTMWNGIAG